MAVFSFLKHPQGILATIMVLACALVNGWTDAPVAITTVVATKSLSIKKAAVMAGAFNLFGAIFFIFINQNVALTVFNIADLSNNHSCSLSLIISSLAAVNIWSVAAWFLGIPTSESHGILSALSGASFYIYKSFKGINIIAWYKVFIGMLLSIVIGFILGLILIKALAKKSISEHKIKRLHILSSAFLAFMHGAQDSQKFAGIFMLVVFNKQFVNKITVPIWSAVLIGLIISIGTSIGGERIINKTGTKMVELNTVTGLCSNLASSFAMLISSVLGLAVSTTHSSTASLLGTTIGAKKRVSTTDTLDLIIAWVLTLPICFFISYLICAICIAT